MLRTLAQRHVAVAASQSRPWMVRCLATSAPNTDGKPVTQPPQRLGMHEPPVVDDASWVQKSKQRLRDFTDYDKAFAAHAAERRFLVAEATKSYFADMHEMRQHGGKMYHASNKLINAEKAGYMPDFEGSNLDSLKYGEQHVDSFVQPFLQKYKSTEGVQVVELNVQENVLKRLLLKAFVPSIRKNTPAERKDNYTLLFKDIKRIRRLLGMTNQYIGYVFLVDEKCKIRWTAHGTATPEELGNMLAMTDYLNKKRIESLTP